ncbi:MAG TPA: ferritin-like domain-containing protein [Roseiarcus sp.]|nr:ferritin-like domain-containing protein [Roseiarcus sp.]
MHCEQVNDRVSRNLFESLTTDEEKHIDFLEAQLTLIEQLGVQLYAQKHVGELRVTERMPGVRSRISKRAVGSRHEKRGRFR